MCEIGDEGVCGEDEVEVTECMEMILCLLVGLFGLEVGARICIPF